VIKFEKISKVFPNGVMAVADLTLEIKSGEVLILLGKSGSGKTTIMRMINHLVDPSSGKLYVDGKEIREYDPLSLRRQIGYAIQHVGLFPHMTVEENIALLPRLLKWPEEKIQSRVEELLNMIRLNPQEYRKRYPRMLSGGERQRVGVARALSADPPIILMDEPFGALDPLTREELQNEFLELQSNLKKTVVFVTHDILEAVKLGDRIGVIDQGQLIQLSSPSELVECPASEFIDQFLGPHRFHLSLLTRTIRSLLPETSGSALQKGTFDRHYLSARHSVFEAMNVFKSSKKETLPVYDGKKYLGEFKKSELFEIILKIM
jgi:osmoprotectant transport system ATP-binding protein